MPTNPDDSSAEEQKRVNSAVQARIEAMFASVEAESGTPGECAAAILPVMTRIITHVEHILAKDATFVQVIAVLEKELLLGGQKP